MSSGSSNIKPPGISSGRRRSRRGSARRSRRKNNNQYPEIAKKLSRSRKRCLKNAGITEERLEILAMTDFKPLLSRSKDTLAGEMFDLRVNQRDADIESVKVSLENLEETLPDEFTAALLQYNSALTAAETDIALLKIMILLQKYSTHTARLLSFIDEYPIDSLDDELDLDFLGNNALDRIKNACGIKFRTDQRPNAAFATQILAQIAVAINSCASGAAPYLSQQKRSMPGTKFCRRWKYVLSTPKKTSDFAFDLAKLSRDLTFSQEIVKIKNDSEADEDFKDLINNTFGESWATAAVRQKKNVLSQFTGTSYSTSAVYQGKDLRDVSSVNTGDVGAYVNSNIGIMSILFNGNIAPLETESRNYPKGSRSKTFTAIDPIVDNAFSGPKVLDFSEFNDVIDEIIQKISELVEFGKVGFRILEDKLEGAAPRGFGFTAAEQPLSSTSIAAVMLDVYNRRFASVFGPVVYKQYKSWLSPEHVAYTRLFAWTMIRDAPDKCIDIIDNFLDDYEKGWLTAAAQPATIEGSAEKDEEGNDIPGTEEIAPVQHVLPGTTTVVSVTGKYPRADSNNAIIKRYFEDEIRQARPASILSTKLNDVLGHPKIRVNYDRLSQEFQGYFGDPNPDRLEEGDLRLITPIAADFVEKDYRGEGGSEGKTTTTYSYYGAKIIQAEIIDTFVEVLRILLEPFTEVAPAAEGDPVFPYIEGQIASPYTRGPWHWSGQGYDQFQIPYWVSTIQAFKETFLRDDNTSYLYERNFFDRQGMTSSIVGALSSLMSKFDMIEVRSETLNEENMILIDAHASTLYNKKMKPICALFKLKDTEDGDIVPATDTTRYSFPGSAGASSGGVTTSVVASSAAATPMLPVDLGNIFNRGTGYSEAKSFFKSKVPSTITSILDQESLPLQQNNDTSAAGIFNQSITDLVNTAYENDAAMVFLFDFLDRFAQRVDGYRNAVTDLVDGEGTILGELITGLRELGPPGEDVLQNISSNQLALKQIAVAEESGDPDNGYLPNLSILTKDEINAIRALCREMVMRSPEGDTTKCIVVGIPVGAFAAANIDSEFCLRLSYVDSEYPQLVFAPKSYKFDKDLFILPENFEKSQSQRASFSTMIKRIGYSKLRIEVIESSDASPVITLEDDLKTLRYSSTNPDIYSNLAVSEVLKMYYRVMLGVNFSENAFPSEPGGVDLEISEAAADLVTAMASNIQEIANFSEGLAENIEDVIGDITKFEDPDSFVSGEIQAVDDALLSGLKNAYQTRVFSPEVLRSRAISAKMFDRTYILPVDPDEFYIVPPSSGEDDVSTPQQVFDLYLNAGIIEDTGKPAPRQYKLAPRKSAEGSMALGKVSVTMNEVSDNTERLLDL